MILIIGSTYILDSFQSFLIPLLRKNMLIDSISDRSLGLNLKARKFPTMIFSMLNQPTYSISSSNFIQDRNQFQKKQESHLILTHPPNKRFYFELARRKIIIKQSLQKSSEIRVEFHGVA